MRVVVAIKQVPETATARIDERTGLLARSASRPILNPLDLHAVEAAVRLAARRGWASTAVSMGPPSAADALREALAMGIGDAVHVSDPRLAGSDTWATAHALAAAIRRLAPYAVVLCGERATDGDTGQVGPMLATALGLPLVAFACAMPDIAPDGRTAVVTRAVESGRERWEVPLPFLATVSKEVAVPGLPTLAGKMRARRAILSVQDASSLCLLPSDIGLAGSPTRVDKLFRPKVAREAVLLRVPPGDASAASRAAAEAMALLRARGVLPR